MAGSERVPRRTASRRELTGRAGLRLLLEASDERLVALARAGDAHAFAAIVERYRAPLLRYCRGFLPPSAAEDALQQTFINAHAALVRGEAAAPVALRPWLYRVAHNAALNVARDPQGALERLPESLDGVRRPDEVFQEREQLRRVVGAVAALPSRQREVIVRHALDGDSHERIATDLRMSAGSVRQLAHRARRTVRAAAAAVVPTPVLRLLPWGSDAAELASSAGGGAVVKVAVAAALAGAAGGGAVGAVSRDAEPRSGREVRADAAGPRAIEPVRARPDSARLRTAPVTRSGSDRAGRDSPKSGSSGGGSESGSSGSGSSGSGSSGSGSSGSGSSGSGSSGSGSSGSGSSGSGSSGSGSSGSGVVGQWVVGQWLVGQWRRRAVGRPAPRRRAVGPRGAARPAVTRPGVARPGVGAIRRLQAGGESSGSGGSGD